jgi:hypothetical protein
MNLHLLILSLIMFTQSPCVVQVKSAVQNSLSYSDSVLRLLVRSSQLAVDRQKSLLRRSALGANETSGIRRSSTMTPGDLEKLSEFRQNEISRMEVEFRPERSRPSETNRLAQIAEKNSYMDRLQILQLLRGSDDPGWARRVKQSATSVEQFARMLQSRSLASDSRKRAIERLSLDP